MNLKALLPDKKHRILFIGICAVLLVGLIVLLLVLSAPEGSPEPTVTTAVTTQETTAEATTEATTAPTEQTLPEETAPPQLPEDVQDPQSKPSAKPQGNGGTKVELTPEVIQGAAENGKLTMGIDVSKYQGTIHWEQVAAAGIDFAIVRVGYRTMVSGEIVADPNARYNLQQAHKYGIRLGAYFFSTAISAEEAVQEANWVADFISRYPITYPVAYNCEGFHTPENRQYSLTKTQRTDIALSFLSTLQQRGYTPMFYASLSDMQGDAQWEVSRIDTRYKVWVAQYPALPYPQTQRSGYTGKHAMWQYSSNGVVPGISKSVDVNIAYFGYDSTQNAQNPDKPEDVLPDVEALMSFTAVNESVTAKMETNLRNKPSQGADSQVLYTLKNGQVAQRVGISDSGWSKLEYNGSICYAVSSLLTTDLTPKDTEPATPEPPATVQTQFSPVNEQVTAKDVVNLRSLPSTTHADSQVLAQLKKGEIAQRVGISENGWSKLEFNGTVCYAISSYLTTDINSATEKPDSNTITTPFTTVNEQVTAKDAVNLRSMPSTTNENAVVVAQLKHGQIITRTGINTDVGWSRVVYEGQVLYCISSYLQPADQIEETQTPAEATIAPTTEATTPATEAQTESES